VSSRDIDDSSEDVLADWQSRESDDASSEDGVGQAPPWGVQPAAEPTASLAPAEPDAEPDESPAGEPEAAAATVAEPGLSEPESQPETESPAAGEAAPEVDDSAPMTIELSQEHAAGDLDIPDGYAVLEGEADGGRRAVGVVVARFNGSVTSRLLEAALAELDTAGVRREAITILVVPGAFELPLAATALAKTRRFACIVALGCVIRGDTPHFDYVASEAASGLQLAALETGVPVSFGVLTLDRVEQADARIAKAAEAVRSALEMADVFSHLRAAASR
jgi:6,7-dimethyl-8-ribityllumazine synthase